MACTQRITCESCLHLTDSTANPRTIFFPSSPSAVERYLAGPFALSALHHDHVSCGTAPGKIRPPAVQTHVRTAPKVTLQQRIYRAHAGSGKAKTCPAHLACRTIHVSVLHQNVALQYVQQTRPALPDADAAHERRVTALQTELSTIKFEHACNGPSWLRSGTATGRRFTRSLRGDRGGHHQS